MDGMIRNAEYKMKVIHDDMTEEDFEKIAISPFGEIPFSDEENTPMGKIIYMKHNCQVV